MAEKEIPFRQIHLDFHTSEAIEGVCSEFDAEEFAQTLADAHVNSITLFSCGHHGNLYYDSKMFPEMVHPHLAHRDLLREQAVTHLQLQSVMFTAYILQSQSLLSMYSRQLPKK